ncbi:MAG: 3-phosphoshikimate 1-carboxyvinyltransferase [Longimicrobiales bacterium]
MKVRGSVSVPGDKSITHRMLTLAALAPGTSQIGGALTSLDARSSAAVLRRLGAEISPLRSGRSLRIKGRQRFREPSGVLYCGNSGTTARLLMGTLAGHDFPATVTGDRSLSRRPMRRVTIPLRRMGARADHEADDGLPVTIRGGRLEPLRYEMPVASAQVKGCLLLAGLIGGVPVSLREPAPSRDHTERLLRSFGYSVTEADGWIEFVPQGSIEPFQADVPGDVSSAAFLVGLALLAEGGELRISGVGLNPTRTAFLDVLERMGASVDVETTGTSAGEPMGDLVVRPGLLSGVEVKSEEIPGIIDEIPMLAVLASRAEGTTIFREAGELRVKESDRLGLLASNLRGLGASAEVSGDDLVVEGADRPARGAVRTAGDHRLAMAFTVLGTVPGAAVLVDNIGCVDVSFPGFLTTLKALQRRGRE